MQREQVININEKLLLTFDWEITFFVKKHAYLSKLGNLRRRVQRTLLPIEQMNSKRLEFVLKEPEMVYENQVFAQSMKKRILNSLPKFLSL